MKYSDFFLRGAACVGEESGSGTIRQERNVDDKES
jgi:hypothetical protein